jgi:hypothetical protein
MTLTDCQLQSRSELFPCRQLLPGLTICESIEQDANDNWIDRHHWGNATDKLPPFIIYIGYNTPAERDDRILQLRRIWKIQAEITYRAALRVKGYWYEIKVRGLQRNSDPNVFDLDYLSESKQYGLDYLVYLIQSQQEEAEYEELVTSRILTQC